MPTLRQRKDGKCYVRAWVPAQNTICTWQLTSRGVEILRQHGYSQDGDEFSRDLLQQLVKSRDAFTQGSGLTLGNLPEVRIKREKPRSTLQTTRLLFLRQDDRWRLALHIQELPRHWYEQVPDLVAALSGWRITIDGTQSVPAMRLYPGRGGVQVVVPPKIGFYEIIPEGDWPSAWDVRTRIIGTVGLTSDRVTVFDHDTGERRQPDAMLEPGECYILVMEGRRFVCPPDGLELVDLGQCEQWQAWKTQVPHELTDQLRRWFDQIGLSLTERRYRLYLTTPPYTYTRDGRPVVIRGEDVVLALAPIDGNQAETTFYTLRIDEAGSFCVELEEQIAAPLCLEVQERQVLYHPPPPDLLSVKITWGASEWIFRASGNNGEPPSVTPPVHRLSDDVLQVEVTGPELLDLALDVDGHIEQFPTIEAEEVVRRIRETIIAAMRQSRALTIQLNGGVFGCLILRLASRRTKTTAPGMSALTPATLQRTRWLATVLPALRRSTPEAALPANMQRTLMRAIRRPECDLLTHPRTIPLVALPAIRALKRAIDREGI